MDTQEHYLLDNSTSDLPGFLKLASATPKGVFATHSRRLTPHCETVHVSKRRLHV